MTLRIASVAWKLRAISSDSEFFAHFYDLVEKAHDAGAHIIVLPELQVLELLHLEPKLKEIDIPRYLIQFSEAVEEWIQRISTNSGLTLVGGSHFKETPNGIVNACAVGHPSLGLVISAKNNLTRYEREIWGLSTGDSLVKIPDRRLGVTICYDSEFPESGRALAEEGVVIQCVPAFTETEHGFNRVRWCCHARTIENQVFVAHASLVGDLAREPVPHTYGSSAILCPAHGHFPASGILASTDMNEEGIAIADLDLDQLEEVRNAGDVRNWHDRHASEWPLGRSL